MLVCDFAATKWTAVPMYRDVRRRCEQKKRTRTNGHKLQQYRVHCWHALPLLPETTALHAKYLYATVCTNMNLCACGSEINISLKPVPFLVSTVAIVWRKLLHAKVKLDQAGRIPLSTEIYFYLRSFTCLLLNAVMIFQFWSFGR